MVQSLFIPSLCLCPAVTIVILMIWLLTLEVRKVACLPALLNIYCAKVTGRILVN